jgi:hypothetical protein
MKRIIVFLLSVASLCGQLTFPSGVYNPLLAKDNIQTSLIAPMAVGDNVAVVQSGTGWAPQMVAYICDSSSGSPAKCTSYEVMLVTAVAGNVLTVTRAYGGSTAKTHASGKLVQNAYTSVYTNSAQNEIQAMQKFGGSGRFVDLRSYGAVCDGATNVQPAVTAAIAAGYTKLFLPANCLWTPTGFIPAGITVLGEDWQTSKIWPNSPTTTFVGIGSRTVLQNVNLNGPICNQPTLGCPAIYYVNSTSKDQPVQNFPYNVVFADVGSTAGGALPGGINDTNGIVVLEHANGGGIYGQYMGDETPNSGSGIHAYQASPSTCSGCAGLRVTKGASGTGIVIDSDRPEGGTGTDIQFVSGVKTAGTIFDFFHANSNYSGTMIHANLGATGGAFTGDFESYDNNNVAQWQINQSGSFFHNGYEQMPAGSAVASGSTIVPTGSFFHVTGTNVISTIVHPVSAVDASKPFCFRVVPDGSFTTNTTGNIGAATAAVPGKVMTFCWDGAAKYYPSY